MKKVLITGGSGYLGANISEVLADSGYNVTVFDRSLKDNNPLWASKMNDIILGDITDLSLINEISNKNFNYVIHMISLDHFASQSDPDHVLNVNVLPTWNLLNSFKDKKLKAFLYFSTQQVLGKIPNSRIDEYTEPLPLNHYGLTHLLSEQIVNYYKRSYGMNGVNIRLSNGYGPPVFKSNNCWWLVVNDLCKTAYIEGKIQLQSDGTPQRDFIFVKDIGRAVKSVLENIELFGDVVNIGYGKTYTILELAHIVKDVYYRQFNKHIDIFFPNGTISNSVTDNYSEKFTWVTDNLQKCGFKPEVSIEDGIKSVFEYLKKSKFTN